MPTNNLNMDWWDSLSKHEQEKYVKKHKNTEYRKHIKQDKPERNKPEPVNVNYNDAINQAVQQEINRTPKEYITHHAKKLHAKIKTFKKEQQEFFQSGYEKPDSEPRREAASIIKRKAKGIVKKFKHEMHEDKEAYSSAAQAMKSLLTGKKLDETEKKHLKTAATKLAILAGMTVATGGAGGMVHGVGIGLVHFGAHAVAHRLLEAGITGSAASLVYASAMFEYSSKLINSDKIENMSEDEIMEYFVKLMGEGTQTAPIKMKQWVEAFDKHNKNEKKVKAMLLKECRWY